MVLVYRVVPDAIIANSTTRTIATMHERTDQYDTSQDLLVENEGKIEHYRVRPEGAERKLELVTDQNAKKRLDT